MRGDIKEDFNGVLDNRGVGGSEYHTNQILEAIKSMRILTTVVSPSLVEDESRPLMVISDEENELESESDFSDEDIRSELGVIVERRCRMKTAKIMKKAPADNGLSSW